MDREELLNRVFKRPLIVASTEYRIPAWMKAKIRDERITQAVQGRQKATNAEVFVYLYTLSKIQPFNRTLHRIYLLLFYRYMRKRGVTIPENFLEVEKIKKKEAELLDELKNEIYHIQESRVNAKQVGKSKEVVTLDTFLEEKGKD